MTDEAVPNLRGGHWTTLKVVLGIVGSVVAFVGGKVYEAGRWAEQSEQERIAQARDHVRIDSLENAVTTMKVTNEFIQRDISEIKSGIKDLAAAKQKDRR